MQKKGEKMKRETMGSVIFKGEELKYEVNYVVEESYFVRDVFVEYLEDGREMNTIPYGCYDFDDVDERVANHYKFDVLETMWLEEMGKVETQKEVDVLIKRMNEEFDNNKLNIPDTDDIKCIIDYEELA